MRLIGPADCAYSKTRHMILQEVNVDSGKTFVADGTPFV